MLASLRNSLNEDRAELLADLVHKNPIESDRRFSEDSFDPKFRRETLRLAEGAGLIEVERADIKNWSFRITAKGRENARELI